ncbi:MAG: PilZ domain-containing protein [Chitinophagaceae bacterium]|nr:PilZ domain-containing protein [Oligoflexus sp.]
MSDQIWYLYQNGQQVGPFETEQVTQLYINNMISKDGYLFKVGWKDWRPLEDGYEALGIPNPNSAKSVDAGYQEDLEKRREVAPRASIVGRVVVHNNGQLAVGHGVNISVGGIFVETSDQMFTVGETLRLSIRVDGLSKAFNAEAVVIRFNTDKRFSLGYGMKFVKIDPEIQKSIQGLVNAANEGGDRGRFAKQV